MRIQCWSSSHDVQHYLRHATDLGRARVLGNAAVMSRMSLTTEITIVGGERFRVEGGANEVEALILSAARGSIMELAWMTEADTGERIGINPEHVMMLRQLGT